MTTTHSFTIVARCPVQDCPDVYECTVTTNRVIRVEDILEAVKAITQDGPILQEELTTTLATRIEADVKTTGMHSGVKTVCAACGDRA